MIDSVGYLLKTENFLHRMLTVHYKNTRFQGGQVGPDGTEWGSLRPKEVCHAYL